MNQYIPVTFAKSTLWPAWLQVWKLISLRPQASADQVEVDHDPPSTMPLLQFCLDLHSSMPLLQFCLDLHITKCN